MDKRAVSPDSSTQITEKKKKEKKQKSKHRSKRKRSHLKSFSSSQDGDSDSGQAESKWGKSCQGSVKHLTDYLHDREELHLQLFTIFSKKEIKGLLPDALKELGFTEVKERCFEQLQKMSDWQIESILGGKVLALLDYDSDNEPAAIPHETQSTERQDTKSKHTKQQEKTMDKEIEDKEENDMTITLFQEMFRIPKQEDIDKLVQGTSVLTEQASDISRSGESSVDAESELKELEFRARALESLVRAREQQMNLDED
ncbi:caspase activity and apoptosis inhibitor 1-like isoform X1 [Acropora muricata]|uniref:caspase activity and apoptosis inhibitor 1-like isoform X1 n=1 Tax=Acropora muricata TaxID=159855 RepID=UPI0034E57BB9